jgi:primosomal replication protein N
LSLKHESTVTQDGAARKVSMEIRARAIGVQITQRLAAIDLGSEHGFAGFLGSQRNGRGVVFHVTELD